MTTANNDSVTKRIYDYFLSHPEATPKEACSALGLDYMKYANMVAVSKTYLRKKSIPREFRNRIELRERELTIKLKILLEQLGFSVRDEKFDLYLPDIVAVKNDTKFIFEVKAKNSDALDGLRQLACAKICEKEKVGVRYVVILQQPPSFHSISIATKYGFEFWIFKEEHNKIFSYEVSLKEIS